MTLRDKILSMRHNEFGLSKVVFFGSDKDVFPYRIHIVKWEECKPTETYSLTELKYKTVTSYCFVIGELEWDTKEPGWDFRSLGTRYLEYGTQELNKWILDFCRKYSVVDGEIVETQE